jgi:hypothetical protein
MDLQLLQQYCERGDLENVKKICLEAKLVKETIFCNYYDYNYYFPFYAAYSEGHFDVCKFFIFEFHITKKDILHFSNYYIKRTLDANSDDIKAKYVNFLIEQFGITEEDLQYYLKYKGEDTRNKIMECFIPLGSCTKPAKN